MSDVVLAAAFSSLGAALVAIAGAFASIFGPAWMAKSTRRQKAERARDDGRFSAALAFTEALTSHGGGVTTSSLGDVLVARSRFVATLRRGEGAAARFTAMIAERVDHSVEEGSWEDSLFEARLGSDELFAWLRGDTPIEQLDVGVTEFLERAAREH